MKLFKVSAFLVLLVAGCLPAVAQTQMRLNVPFNFFAAGKALPAGRYIVERVFIANDAAWVISGDHGSANMLTNPASSTKRTHKPSLVFLNVGKTYSLVQIWPDEDYGRDLLMKSKVKTTLLAEGGKYVEIGAE